MTEEYLLVFTKKQINQLFALKRYLQDHQGIHYLDSGYNQLQDKEFLQDVINGVCWHWQEYDKQKIERVLSNEVILLPKDVRKKE